VLPPRPIHNKKCVDKLQSNRTQSGLLIGREFVGGNNTALVLGRDNKLRVFASLADAKALLNERVCVALNGLHRWKPHMPFRVAWRGERFVWTPSGSP
jgi:hypothetical protein